VSRRLLARGRQFLLALHLAGTPPDANRV